MLTGNSESIAIQSLGMAWSSYERPDVGHARQVCSVQAADRAAPDDADSLHVLASGPPLDLYQIRRAADFPLERTEQAVCIIKGIFDKDSLVEQGILQRS